MVLIYYFCVNKILFFENNKNATCFIYCYPNIYCLFRISFFLYFNLKIIIFTFVILTNKTKDQIVMMRVLLYLFIDDEDDNYCISIKETEKSIE